MEDERNVDDDNRELLETNEVEQPVRIDKSLSRPDPLAGQNTKSKEIVEEETTNTIENDKASKPRTISKEERVILDNEKGNSTDEEEFEPGKVIVGFNKPHSEDDVRKKFPELKIKSLVDQDERLYEAVKAAPHHKKERLKRLEKEIGKDYVITLGNKTKKSVIEAIKLLENNDDVKYAVPNHIVKPTLVPNDTSYPSQWGLNKIQAQSAWDTFTGSSSVKVGVLDSGIDSTHSDLVNNLDMTLAYNAHTHNSTNLYDGTGHGTHVAGIIGAKGNNSTGICGINWNVSIVPIKIAVNDVNGGTTDQTIADAIYYAIEKELPICNMSYSFNGVDTIYNAVEAYEGLLVIAAGNDGRNIDNGSNYTTLNEMGNVIFVANSDQNDNLLPESNYGVKNVHIAAPGHDIYSTIPSNSYGYKGGTSMAAPFVTGVAALLKGNAPTLTTTQIKNILLSSVDYPESLRGLVATGRLNAYKAINQITDPNTLVVEPNDNETMSAAITRCLGNKVASNITYLKLVGDADMAATGTNQSSASVVLPNLTYVDAGCFSGVLCDRAFINCSSLATVVLPPDNYLLRSLTFYNCTNLTAVYKASSKRRLSGEADLSGLSDTSSGGYSTVVGIQCFQGCTGLTTVRLPYRHKVKFSIYAFNNCTNLSKVFMEGYPEITGEADLTEMYAFSEGVFRGTAINKVKLPKDVTISNKSFENCSNLSVIQFHPNQTLSLSIGQNAFSNVNSSCVAYVSQLVYNNLNNLVIPRTSNANIPIEVNALVIQPITNDTIEDAIDDYIGNINQNSIKHLVIKGSANMSYGGSANILPNLETADLSEYTGQAEKGTFYYCTHLKQVIYSSNTTKIPSYTFMGCSNLEAVQRANIPQKLWLVDLSNMNGTWALNTQAFNGCTSIQTVRLPKIMQNEEFSIGQYAFEGCTNLITIYRENQEIKVGTANLTGVTSFGSGHAFDNIRIGKVDLPKDKNIPIATFMNCINLNEIRFDRNQTTPCVIGYQSFYNVNSQCKAYMNTTLYNNSGFVIPRNDTEYIEKRAY